MTGIKTCIRCAFLAVMALACTAGSIAQNKSTTDATPAMLTLPVAIFIVDAEGTDDTLSSQRTLKSMDNHYQQVNRVWQQAGIKFDPVTVKRIKAPRRLLHGLIHERGRGGIARFYRAIRNGEIDIGIVDSSAVIYNFYVRSLGGPNGLKPQGVNSIFVVDDPINDGYRVTSHEIGHILGLYHARYDANKLLFSGSNGTVLTNEEKTVARYFAERLAR